MRRACRIASSDIFVGQPREQAASDATRTHLFGGLIAAQAVVAASRTVPPAHRIHSLHSHFILAGDGRKPIVFQVTRTRDGGSMTTRQVAVTQDNEVIFLMTASFHKDEPGPEFQRPPEELASILNTLMPAHGGGDTFHTAQSLLDSGKKPELGGNPPWSPDTGSLDLFSGLNHSLAWRRHLSTVADTDEDGEPVEGSWCMHAALLAFMSDEGLLSTVRQPYGGTAISMSTSLDHTIHFHRRFRSDEWLLFHNETTVSSGARGVARTEVFDERGILVASFMQEGLVRPPRGWEPEEHQEAQLERIAAETQHVLQLQTKPEGAKL